MPSSNEMATGQSNKFRHATRSIGSQLLLSVNRVLVLLAEFCENRPFTYDITLLALEVADVTASAP